MLYEPSPLVESAPLFTGLPRRGIFSETKAYLRSWFCKSRLHLAEEMGEEECDEERTDPVDRRHVNW